MQDIPILTIDQSQESLLKSYLIIDCAHFEESYYQILVSNSNYKAVSLFKNTVQEIAALAQSPVLIEISSEIPDEEIQALLALSHKHPYSFLWLWSNRNFYATYQHLQSLLFEEGKNGYKVLMRFYDPRCLEELLEVFRQDPLKSRVLNNFVAWAYQEDNHYQYLWNQHEDSEEFV